MEKTLNTRKDDSKKKSQATRFCCSIPYENRQHKIERVTCFPLCISLLFMISWGNVMELGNSSSFRLEWKVACIFVLIKIYLILSILRNIFGLGFYYSIFFGEDNLLSKPFLNLNFVNWCWHQEPSWKKLWFTHGLGPGLFF